MNKSHNFHPGERYLQRLSGVNIKVAEIAPRLIRDYLTVQHQEFYPQLNTLFVASVDKQGRSWASILTGQAGFIHILDKKRICIKAKPLVGDPLINNLKSAEHIGLLGLQFETRRRNRVSGQLLDSNNSDINIEVIQTFGNCPKYIQSRKVHVLDNTHSPQHSQHVHRVEYFDDTLKQMISTADTFFIASYNPDTQYRGADMSHRGGKPGFVRIENNKTLCFDDYSGNNFYMTLGNIVNNPIVGLLFIDFKTGDTLQLSAHCEIIEPTKEKTIRQIRLEIDYGWLTQGALTLDCKFLEYSPFLD